MENEEFVTFFGLMFAEYFKIYFDFRLGILSFYLAIPLCLKRVATNKLIIMALYGCCVPGQRLCKHDGTVHCGSGTYVRDGFIHACRVGWPEYSSDKSTAKTIHISTEENNDTIPSIGDLIIAKVTNVNPRFCKCEITCVGTSPLTDVFRGLVRKEDVRATEKDRVEMYKCFRPGDIIVARVLSLGDSLSYLLTTAENELGVVMATSEAGVNMVPLSWSKMQCPKTLSEEFRKVAKIQPQYISFVQSIYT